MNPKLPLKPMKIERLVFQVRPLEYSKDFLQADAEVWNPWLKRQPGFLNKTSRIVRDGLVELSIFWKDEDSVDKASEKIKEMEMIKKFMGDRFPGSYTLVLSSLL